MADIKVVIDTVLNDKGLHVAGQGVKTFGATLGIAVGAAYAFNAALDKAQERLEAIGETDSAAGIEDAQQAWTALSDTLLSIGQQTGALDWLTGGLESAANAMRQVSVLAQLFVDDMKFATGQITALESQANQIAIVEKAQSVHAKSIASSKKEENKTQKDITSELEKQAALQMDSEEAIRKMDARARQKAQRGLTSIGGKIDRLDPNSRSNMGISENATRAVTVTFKGNDAVAALVQDVIIDGVREN